MSTLTIHPADMDQETAIRLFLDALHVSYKATVKDIDGNQIPFRLNCNEGPPR